MHKRIKITQVQTHYTNVNIYNQHHVLLPAPKSEFRLSINQSICLSIAFPLNIPAFPLVFLAVLHSTRDFSLLLTSSCAIDRRGAGLTMQPGPCSALHLSEGASILPLFSTLSIFFSSSKLFIQWNSEWKTWEVEKRIEQEKWIVRPYMLPRPWIARNIKNQRTNDHWS